MVLAELTGLWRFLDKVMSVPFTSKKNAFEDEGAFSHGHGSEKAGLRTWLPQINPLPSGNILSDSQPWVVMREKNVEK